MWIPNTCPSQFTRPAVLVHINRVLTQVENYNVDTTQVCQRLIDDFFTNNTSKTDTIVHMVHGT